MATKSGIGKPRPEGPTAQRPSLAQDAVYAAARKSGFDDGHIDIYELEKLPYEVFEVVVGINGVDADPPMRIGTVTLLPSQSGRRILDQFDPYPEWAGEFEDVSTHAVVYITGVELACDSHSLRTQPSSGRDPSSLSAQRKQRNALPARFDRSSRPADWQALDAETWATVASDPAEAERTLTFARAGPAVGAAFPDAPGDALGAAGTQRRGSDPALPGALGVA